MALIAGRRLGPYQVLAPLGAGGMGEVYRARDTRLDRDVALKVLPERIAGNPQALARFEREAKAVAALSHPNILAVYDYGREEGIAYVVTELLDGETLRAALAGGALPVRKAVDYAVQAAHGLAAAHDKHLVHRDVKPENLFVTGCVLYEMLAGRRAFQRETAAETMTAILKDDVPEWPETGRPVPPALDRLLRRCLEKKPEERLQSARDLALALEALTAGDTSGAATPAPPVGRGRSGVLRVAGLLLVGAGLGYLAAEVVRMKVAGPPPEPPGHASTPCGLTTPRRWRRPSPRRTSSRCRATASGPCASSLS